MGGIRAWVGGVAAIVSSAIAMGPLPSAYAVAAQVPYFVNVQPIAVCPTDSSGPNGCASTGEPGSGVGFLDPAGNDITRAILNQAGIDVHYLPTQFLPNSSLQNLVVEQGTVPGQLTSSGLQVLTDQSSISMGNAPSPAPPLALDPHTVNLFFINTLNNGPNVTGTYFGLSWISNNGVSVAQNTFGSVGPRGIVGAVPDTLAHEIVHNLGLDHPTDNTPQATSNLMSVVRLIPTIAKAVASLGGGLGTGTTDQLNAQQVAQILNPDGGPLNSFLNPVSNVVASVAPSGPSDTASAIASALVAAPIGSEAVCSGDVGVCGSNPAVTNDFSVSFENEGRPGTSLLNLTLTAPAGVLFDAASFFPLQIEGDTPGVSVTPTFSNCTNPGENIALCGILHLAFAGTPFVLGDRFDYTVDFCLEGDGVCLADTAIADLAGAKYTFGFSDGYQPTSVLSLVDGSLSASSWVPDLTTPTGLDLSLFTPFSTGLPCAIAPPATTCPELNLAAENYDELIFQDVPEPSGIAVILGSLGVWFGLGYRRRRA